MFCFWALQTHNLFRKDILEISIRRPTHVEFLCQNLNTHTESKTFRGYIPWKCCLQYDVSNLRGIQCATQRALLQPLLHYSFLCFDAFQCDYMFL
jgi:hypothetical protein